MTTVPEDHIRNIDTWTTILLDLVKVAVIADPAIAVAAPGISFLIEFGAARLKAGIADGSLISDGRGGFVTQAWADDPRHALNTDGTFKY